MEEKILMFIQGLRNYGLEPTTIKVSMEAYAKIADSPRLRDGQEMFGLKVEIVEDLEYECIVE